MIPGFSFVRSSSGQVQRVRRIYPAHASNEIVVSNNAKYQANISKNAAFLARLTKSIYVEYIGFIRALAKERQGATRTQEGRVIVACAMCRRAGGMQRTTHADSVASAAEQRQGQQRGARHMQERGIQAQMPSKGLEWALERA